MHINEVESITGLTKKSIRYYEEQELLSPNRNNNNDYREYSKRDIDILKKIKFLRSLNVSILDIKRLQNNTLSLRECMSERIDKIEAEELNFQKIKNMCEEIKDSNLDINTLDISKYLVEMNILNKDGFTMKKIIKNNRRKIFGACLSSLISSLFFLAFVILFTIIKFSKPGEFPWTIYLILMLIFTMPLLGIVINLIKRIKEIRGGEEDEASKY